MKSKKNYLYHRLVEMERPDTSTVSWKGSAGEENGIWG